MGLIHLTALDEKLIVPDNVNYDDLGDLYDVPKTIQTIVETYLNSGLMDKNQAQKILNTVSSSVSGVCLNFVTPDSDLLNLIILYQKQPTRAQSLCVRGHEEGHVLFRLGFYRLIEKILGQERILDKNEEDICDLLGLEAVKRQGLVPHPLDLIPYFENKKLVIQQEKGALSNKEIFQAIQPYLTPEVEEKYSDFLEGLLLP